MSFSASDKTAASDVALLVPCRNGAKFLPRLAAGARAQSSPFAEWLLFDDGSTDATASVARELGFVVLRSEHRTGPAAARNALARATRCTWLHFHDADDLIAADYVTASLAAARDGAELVVCDMPWIDARTGELIFHWRYDEDALRATPYAALIQQTIGGINALYRRSMFERVGGFDATRDYWEDLDLALRMFRAGVAFHIVRRDLVTAVRHEQSYSSQDDTKVWMSKIDLMAEWLGSNQPNLALTIAREAENIAVRMVGLGKMAEARRALRLCQCAGGKPPTSANPGLNVLRHILPAFTVLRLQQYFRRLASG